MNKFFTYLPIYYINLDHRVDRNNYMLNQFDSLGIKEYFRISGVNPTDVVGKYDFAGLDIKHFSCSLANILAIKKFYDSGKEFAMICEDDADFYNSKKMSFSFYDTLDYFNQELYCLQTSYSTREEFDIRFNLQDTTFWHFNTTSYIINKKYAKILLDAYYQNNKPTLYNFVAKEVVDYRGGTIKTLPRADELIYSLCDSKTIPIFNIHYSESSIHASDEQYRQTVKSIDQFDKYWGRYDSIAIEDVFTK